MSGKSAVGRTGSLRLYKYPEPRQSGPGAGPFARNFASGPKTEVTVSDGSGTLIAWNAIDVAPATPSTDVPITPLSTGWIRISGVIGLFNIGSEGGPASLEFAILVDDVAIPVPPELEATIEENGAVLLPFLAQIELPLSIEANVSVLITASDPDTVQLVAESSTMELLEVPESTG